MPPILSILPVCVNKSCDQSGGYTRRHCVNQIRIITPATNRALPRRTLTHSTGGSLGRARILLADDHPDLLKMVERHLEPEFEVVGMVLDGQLLLEEAMRLKPDVIVSDISMPLLNGIEAADQLKESGCQSRIVFLTVHSDPDFVPVCLAAGALGYVVKSRMNSYQPFARRWRGISSIPIIRQVGTTNAAPADVAVFRLSRDSRGASGLSQSNHYKLVCF